MHFLWAHFGDQNIWPILSKKPQPSWNNAGFGLMVSNWVCSALLTGTDWDMWKTRLPDFALYLTHGQLRNPLWICSSHWVPIDHSWVYGGFQSIGVAWAFSMVNTVKPPASWGIPPWNHGWPPPGHLLLEGLLVLIHGAWMPGPQSSI